MHAADGSNAAICRLIMYAKLQLVVDAITGSKASGERPQSSDDQPPEKSACRAEDRQALPAGELVRSQPAQLIVSTNRENYITLDNYQ